MPITAVVNTRNEEKNIRRCLQSIDTFVDEIVVVDMESTDQTVRLAREFTNQIYTHPYVGYVEPARNFAINKAPDGWVLLVDADEVVSYTLGIKLKQLDSHATSTYFRIPRKNIIFGKWIKHSGWWPDYKIRFFRKGAVEWSDEIHSVPVTHGKGADLETHEKNALIHYNYQSVGQYLERLNRYTTQEAKQLMMGDYSFAWQNLILKPGHEFITRFWYWEGYKDSLHGLVLSFLQAMSSLVVELKVWEMTKFVESETNNLEEEMLKLFQTLKQEAAHWHFLKKKDRAHGVRKLIYTFRSRFKI